MTCHFAQSLVMAWAYPAEVLEPLVPRGLTLDTYDDRWGFVVVAVVQTQRLRPTWLPAAFGREYALTGYRIFVQHRDQANRSRRGLHILRSDTDKRTMRFGGNLLTHYNYRLAEIAIAASDDRLDVRIDTPRSEADLHVVARLADEPAPVPVTSPFRSARDARRFAGPLPWTFDHEPETNSIVMIHARRSQWRPKPTAVTVSTCTFFERPPFGKVQPRLANAFYVGGIDYGWERGIRVPIEGR